MSYICHTKKNAVSAFQISCKLLSFTLKDSWRSLPWKIPEEISRRSMLSKTVSTISNVIQPFTTLVDWQEIRCLREVSAIFYICRYCVFTWYDRYAALMTIPDVAKKTHCHRQQIECLLHVRRWLSATFNLFRKLKMWLLLPAISSYCSLNLYLRQVRLFSCIIAYNAVICEVMWDIFCQ